MENFDFQQLNLKSSCHFKHLYIESTLGILENSLLDFCTSALLKTLKINLLYSKQAHTVSFQIFCSFSIFLVCY